MFEATLHACRQRLRPILMTSLAFIFGVLPMATSTGAGSGGQHAVGTGVMGGMIRPRFWPFTSCRCSLCWCAAASR
ncbi:efflux RND transporter permease subunit [Shigella sonnei]